MTKEEVRQIENDNYIQYESDDEFDYFYKHMITPLQDKF